MNSVLDVYDLGRMDYRACWDLQKALQQQLIEEKLAARSNPALARSNDVLLLVEHPHVYTLGKSGKQTHLLRTEEELRALDATFVPIDRGGDITYHGPGQLVGYPILDLDRHFTDIHKYMRFLEEVFIRVLSEYGIEAGRKEGLSGTWVGEAKITALGVKCSRWVTMHGFAFNVQPDLSYFGHIIPCGIIGKDVTSLSELLGRNVPMEEVKPIVVEKFAEVFQMNPVLKPLDAGTDFTAILQQSPFLG
jgi:lipoyl(octanoyl) transferase